MTEIWRLPAPRRTRLFQGEPHVLVDVPMRVRGMDGPVRVQELPRKAASAKTWPKLTSTPVRVLTADPYRARAVLTADVDIYVSYVSTRGVRERHVRMVARRRAV